MYDGQTVFGRGNGLPLLLSWRTDIKESKACWKDNAIVLLLYSVHEPQKSKRQAPSSSSVFLIRMRHYSSRYIRAIDCRWPSQASSRSGDGCRGGRYMCVPTLKTLVDTLFRCTYPAGICLARHRSNVNVVHAGNLQMFAYRYRPEEVLYVSDIL
jgi:hypothetical protein